MSAHRVTVRRDTVVDDTSKAERLSTIGLAVRPSVRQIRTLLKDTIHSSRTGPCGGGVRRRLFWWRTIGANEETEDKGRQFAVSIGDGSGTGGWR